MIRGGEYTIRKRILLHLLRFRDSLGEVPAPFEITQEGIARAVAAGRPNVARTLKKMREDIEVFDRTMDVTSQDRKRRTYFLTEQGYLVASSVLEKLQEDTVRVVDLEGAKKSMKMTHLLNILGFRSPVDVLVRLEDDVLLLEKVMKEREEQLSTIVGRKSELGFLKGFVDKVRNRGKFISVFGEAGIGKTRLVNELGAYARSKGFLYLTGASLYHEGADPYLPFIEILSGYFKSADPGELDPAKFESLPLGLQKVGREVQFAEESGKFADFHKITGNLQIERDRLFETTSQIFATIAAKRPILIFLDDLHWADNGTLQLMHYLARTTRENPIIICGAYRPEDIANDGSNILDEILKRMSRERLITYLPLRRLSKDETRELSENILKKPLSEKSVEAVYVETEGNPFFVEEVLLSAMDEGILMESKVETDGTKSEQVELPGVELPRTVQDVLLRRIDRLDKDSARLLEIASVIGLEFDFDVLLDVSEMEQNKLLDSLDILFRMKLIEELRDKQERMKFSHPMIQEVVYKSLSSGRRRVMHLRVGESIERLYTSQSEVFHLARHFSRGGDFERAKVYSIAAAREAVDMHSPEQAVNSYLLALESMDKTKRGAENNPDRICIMCDIGDVFSQMGELDSAVEYYNRAIMLERGSSSPKELARAYRGLARINEKRNEWESAVANYDTALRVSEGILDAGGLAEAYNGLGKVSRRKGELDKAIAYYYNATIQSGKAHDTKGIATSSIDLGNVYEEKGELDMAVEHLEKAKSLLEGMRALPEMARAYNGLGSVYWVKKDFESAIRHFKTCIDIAGEAHDIRQMGYGLTNLGYLYTEKNMPKEAVECVSQALRIFEKLDERYMIAGGYTIYGVIHKLKRNWPESEGYFRKGIQMFKTLNIPYYLGDAYVEFGAMYLDMGERKRAEECFNEAHDIFSTIGAKKYIERVESKLEELRGCT